MSQKTLTPSFRVPPRLDGIIPPEAAEVIRNHDNGIVDLNQAIVALKSQINAMTASTSSGTATTTNVSSTSETVVVSNSATVGMVNNQTGQVAYSTQQSDYGAFIYLSNASPIAVTLTTGTAITIPFFCWISNLGSGAATLTPATGTINGGASVALLANQTAALIYDGTNFEAILIPVAPQNTPAVAGQFLTAFNAGTGAFTQAAPVGVSVTAVLAKITVGGTNGSLTTVNGIVTAYVAPT